MKAKQIVCTALMLVTSLLGFSQTTITGNRIIAKEGLYVVNNWLDSIQRSVEFNSHRTVPTSQAVADYVSSTDKNFANSNLRFSTDRTHSVAGHSLTIDSAEVLQLIMRGTAFPTLKKRWSILRMDGNISADIGDHTQFAHIYWKADGITDSIIQQVRYNGSFGTVIEHVDKHLNIISRLQLNRGFATLRATDSIMIGTLPIVSSADTIVGLRSYNHVQGINTLVKFPLSSLTGTASQGVERIGNDFQLGGNITAAKTWTINASATARLSINGASTSTAWAPFSITDNGPGSGMFIFQNGVGRGLYVEATASPGARAGTFTTNNGFALAAIDNGSGQGLSASSQIGLPIIAISNNPANNSPTTVLKLTRSTGFHPAVGAAGLGADIYFELQNGALPQAWDSAGKISSYWTDATDGSENSAMDFSTMNDGYFSRKFSIKDTGQIQAHRYTPGNFEVTDTTNFKPSVWGPDGRNYRMNGWPVGKPQSFAQTTNGFVSNTTTKTSLIGAGVSSGGGLTIDASKFVVGKTYQLTAYGYMSSDPTAASTFNYRIELNGAQIGTTGNIFLGTNIINRAFQITFQFTVISTGSTGTIAAQGFLQDSNSGGTKIDNGTPGLITIDMTSAKAVDLTVQMGTATANINATTYMVFFKELN